jgi:hypothetical protein
MLARDTGLGYTARRDGVICTDGIPSSIVADSDNRETRDLSCGGGAFLLPQRLLSIFMCL